MAGVQTASPQYLSRGKVALSNVHTRAPPLTMKNPHTDPDGPDPTITASNASAGSVSGVRFPFLTLARLLLLMRVTVAGTATAVTATTAHAVTTFLVSASLMLEIHPRTVSIASHTCLSSCSLAPVFQSSSHTSADEARSVPPRLCFRLVQHKTNAFDRRVAAK